MISKVVRTPPRLNALIKRWATRYHAHFDILFKHRELLWL